MDITPVFSKEKLIIQKYGDGSFETTLGNFSGSIIVTPTKAWNIDFNDIMNMDQNLFNDYKIIIIGTGKTQIFEPKLIEFFQPLGIIPEFMSTAAAIRTFNVLNLEDRAVLAILQNV